MDKYVHDLNTKYFWLYLFGLILTMNAPDGFTVCFVFFCGLAATGLCLVAHLKEKHIFGVVAFALSFVGALVAAISVMANTWCRWLLFRPYA